eukprot:CAMPEP_0198722882 /NCGR_PEP_ID=MMETSP1475-20131203/469_1 /TAXON_ID= ORGANISM="Unidentified sp., Strain CCMP1999" /NCGR_SAMPLE_ID=MMETSP1475 /ASSEMBLY_ACC=CAM_ASM_001111 /LENGTH=711 /DNA_ID=CAMNT_0044483821 /DNA_START=221 /DNA_END=2356 /DNA_ORIENTATION=-
MTTGRGLLLTWAAALVIASPAASLKRFDEWMPDITPAERQWAQSCTREQIERLSNPVEADQLPKSLEDVGSPIEFYSVRGHQCALNSTWYFGLAVRDPTKLLIYLVGGGACFNGATCCPGGNETAIYIQDLPDINQVALVSCLPTLQFDLSGLFGIFDDRTDNAVANYSVLLVPYCTGDVHLGNVSVEYQATNGSTCTVQHQGSSNTGLAMDFAFDLFKDTVTELVVAGGSAGGYGVPAHGAKFLNALQTERPDDRIKTTFLVDAAAGVVAVAPSWQVTEKGVTTEVLAPTDDFPDFTGFIEPGVPVLGGLVPTTQSSLNESTEALRLFRERVALAFPQDLLMLEVSSTEDNSQIFFTVATAQGILEDPECDPANCSLAYPRLIEPILESSAQRVPNYEALLFNGTRHELARRAEWYTTSGVIIDGDGSRQNRSAAAWFNEAVTRELDEASTSSPSATSSPTTTASPSDAPSPSSPPGASPGATSGPPSEAPEQNTASPSPSGTVIPEPEQSDPEQSDPEQSDPEQSDPVCFPADARVTTADGRHRRMDELQVGDRVLVGPGKAETVFMFSHQHREARSTMVHIDTEHAAIELSAGHYLPIRGRLLAAQAVRVGDLITTANGSVEHVVRSFLVQKDGLFHPHTPSGRIVVNGVVATTYTSAVKPRLARVLLWIPMMLHHFGVSNPVENWFLRDNGWIAQYVPKGAAVGPCV